MQPAPTDGSYWVEPRRLLAGRYPEDVRALQAAGVTLFVDLTEEGELPPYNVKPPARHVRMPIADFSTPSARACGRRSTCSTPSRTASSSCIAGAGAAGREPWWLAGSCGTARPRRPPSRALRRARRPTSSGRS